MKRIDFNSDWKFNGRNICLPHDAMLEEKRTPDSPSGAGCGYFGGGKYEYVKVFDAPIIWKNKTINLEFEGVYQNSTVYVNGKNVKTHNYGYTGFKVKIADNLVYGAKNEIRVLVDNTDMPNSRWYTGSGIYRPVNLLIGPENPIKHVTIETISISPAIIRVITDSIECANVEILYKGKSIVSATGNNVEITVPNAKLWSACEPNLYDVVVKTESDEESLRFGIRKISWSHDGLFVNGKRTILKGGCLHHDNGILGACDYKEASYRKVKFMKNYGFNAIRSAHNPISKSMLEACDELGMYVLDELWDMWYYHKNDYDYATYFMKNYVNDIKSMVKKDFSHPSVIMYSIGNEVGEPAEEKGLMLAVDIIKQLKSLDSTRPITAGINLNNLNRPGLHDEQKECGLYKVWANMMIGPLEYDEIISRGADNMQKISASPESDKVGTPIYDLLDIAGYNYAKTRYQLDGVLHPERIIVGSETFAKDVYDNYNSMKNLPYLVGDFIWTAFDYIGEAGLGSYAYTDDSAIFSKPYPWLLGDSGMLDILGNPNGEMFYAESVWSEKPYVKITCVPVRSDNKKPVRSAWRHTESIPSYSFRGRKGKNCEVYVYSNTTYVRLEVNGVAHEMPVEKNIAHFAFPYEPGTLKAYGCDMFGEALAYDELSSAKGRLKINLVKEESVKDNNIIYVDVSITDAQGITEAANDITLNAVISGGILLGFGSANPRTEESFISAKYTTYYGKALAVVKKQAKDCVLTIYSETLHNSIKL